MHIHFSWTPEDAITQQLERELTAKHTLSFGKESPSNTEILVNGRPPIETLESLPQLHSLLIPYAGLNASTRETLKNFGPIDVYNIHHNADSTAEMAIGLMIAAMKQSLKATLPRLNELTKLKPFLQNYDATSGHSFIAHCAEAT